MVLRNFDKNNARLIQQHGINSQVNVSSLKSATIAVNRTSICIYISRSKCLYRAFSLVHSHDIFHLESNADLKWLSDWSSHGSIHCHIWCVYFCHDIYAFLRKKFILFSNWKIKIKCKLCICVFHIARQTILNIHFGCFCFN